MSTAAERAEIRPSEHALAWVFGQPVTDMPQDLFIPPDALKVVLHSFQGRWICFCISSASKISMCSIFR